MFGGRSLPTTKEITVDNEMAFELPDELPGTVAELEALRDEALAELEKITPGEDDGAPSQEVLDEMEALDEALTKIEAALDEVKSAESDRAEKAAAIASKRRGGDEPSDEGDEFSDEGESDDDEDDESDDEDDESDDESDDEDEDFAKKKGSSYNPTNGKNKKKKKGEAAVTAAARRRTSFAGASRSRKLDTPPAPKREFGYRLNGAVKDYTPGYVDTLTLAKAMGDTITGRSTRSVKSGTSVTAQFGHFERPANEFAVNDEFEAAEVIEKATDESNLDGGSLVAAGGWCAPSETVYDFLGTEAAADLLSVPEISVNRGGIKFPVEPEFSAIYTDFPGFHQDETAMIAEEEKTVSEIPCGEFDEVRLDVIGLAITNGILSDKAWPELTRKYIAEIMKAHQHRLSAFRIGKIVDGSTKVTMPGGIGTAGTVLNSVELAVQDIRVKHRIPSNTTIEGFAPVWARAQMRADLAYRQGVLPEQVTDADLDAHFRLRGVNLQFVVDWQTDVIGASSAATAWPETLDIALYPAGTWWSALEPVINLGVTYDLAMLKKNKRVELFTEDGIAVAKRRADSRVYTIPTPVNGEVGARASSAPTAGSEA